MPIMYNPQDGQYYNVPSSFASPTNPYINPNNPIGLYGQNIQQPTQAPRTQPNNGMVLIPVTGIEEARATPVTGTMNIMTNLGAGEIYVARINNEGLKDIITFVVKPPEVVDNPQPAKVVMPDTYLSGVNSKLDAIYQLVEGMKNEPVDNAGNGRNASRAKPGTVSGKQNAEQSAT